MEEFTGFEIEAEESTEGREMDQSDNPPSKYPSCGIPPSGGRSLYLPEPVYFEESRDFNRVRAAQIIAQVVARKSSRYIAFPVNGPRDTRQGILPRGLRARKVMIDEIFAWLQEPRDLGGAPHIPGIGLLLYCREALVLDQHDGVPPTLALTPQEFIEFQEQLEQEGLPHDLYFPEQARRTEPEPVWRFGAVIIGQRTYSPLQWTRRQSSTWTSPSAPLRVPSEAERREVFLMACRQFAAALARRRAELQEPGNAAEPTEVEAVKHLAEQVARVALRLPILYHEQPTDGTSPDAFTVC